MYVWAACPYIHYPKQTPAPRRHTNKLNHQFTSMKTTTINIIKQALCLLPLALTSCHAIYDDEGDCSAEYRVRFIDDLNLKAADAFNSEVKSISLYAFDESGVLVWSDEKSLDDLNAEPVAHSFDVSSLAPGKYHLIAWGGIDQSNGSFSLPGLSRAQTRVEDMSCRLSREQDDSGSDFIDANIDDLFYGSTDIYIPDNTNGVNDDKIFDVQLTKDTNRINIMLQQLNGEDLDPDDYEFVIEADNGELDHQNNVVKEERNLYYRAYEKLSGSAGYADNDATINTVSAILARFTISRLQINDWNKFTRPMLSVYNVTTDEKLLSIPLIDYALLVRNNYDYVTSDQDYLDRQDEYNITFFVQNGRWLDSEIIINSWRVILNNPNL